MGGSSSVSRPAKRTNVAKNNNDNKREDKRWEQASIDNSETFVAGVTKSGTNAHVNVLVEPEKGTNKAYSSDSDEEIANLKHINANLNPSKEAGVEATCNGVQMYNSDLNTIGTVNQGSANEHNETAVNDTVIDIDRCNDEELGSLIKRFLAKVASRENKKGTRSAHASDNLTEDESQLISKLVVERMKRLVNEMKTGEWITKTGQYSKRAKHFLVVFHDSHDILDAVNANIDEFVATLSSLAKLVQETDIIENICELVIDIYQRRIVKYWTSPFLWKPLRHGLGILWNYTDVSEEWAVRVAKTPDFLDIVHKVLFDIRIGASLSTFTEEQQWVLLAALEIIHNISLIDSNIRILREKKFIEALQPHLTSSSKAGHLAALSSLAGIVNEEESEIIVSNKKVVKHLMKVLRKGLRTEERRYHGEYDSWNCAECAVTIKRLGRNDANKKLLIELGALHLLMELAKGTTSEQIEAVNAIWVLSFDDEALKTITEMESSELVEILSNLKESPIEKLKEAANGTLWNLRDELGVSSVNENQKQVEPVISEEKARQDKPYVMISYSWAEKDVVRSLKNELAKNGINVWIDVENLSRGTLEEMAEAVKNAAIVLVCYSQKYKNSPNCRMEMEYAYQLQKPLIPVNVEKGYHPDGWLALLIMSRLVYDFSDTHSFAEETFQRLLAEIKSTINSS